MPRSTPGIQGVDPNRLARLKRFRQLPAPEKQFGVQLRRFPGGLSDVASVVESGAALGPTSAPLFDLMQSVLSLAGVEGSEIEQLGGEIAPGSRVLDVTDPGVDVTGVDLSAAEVRLRSLRRLARGLRTVKNIGRVAVPLTQGPGGTAAGAEALSRTGFGSGEFPLTPEGLVEFGQLAPPASDAEKVADFISASAPGVIAGAPGFLAARGLLAPAASRFVSSAAGQRLVNLAVRVAQARGVDVARTGGEAAARKAAEVYVGNLVQNLGAEAATGVILGAAEGARFAEAKGEVGAGDVAFGAVLGGGLGVTLGGGIALWGGTRSFLKTARAMEEALLSGILPPQLVVSGFQVGNHRAIWRESTGRVVWQRADNAQFSKGPTGEEVREFAARLIDTVKKGTAETDLQAGKHVVQLASEPGSPENQTIETVRALYAKRAEMWRNQFRGREEVIEQEAAARELIAAQFAGRPAGLTAAGQARALRDALGQEVRPLEGAIPIADEVALVDMIRSGFTSKQIAAQGDELERIGRVASADRFRKVASEGSLPLPPELNLVREELRKFRAMSGRGVARNSQVIGPDGNLYRVTQTAFQSAMAKPVGSKVAGSQVIDLRKAVLVPRAGSFMRLKNGQLARAIEVDAGQRTVVIELPNGETSIVSLDLVDLVGESRAMRSALEEGFSAAPLQEQRATLPQPVRAVDAKTGEPVVVEEIGQTTAKVRSPRTRREKVVKREDLGTSAAATRTTAGEDAEVAAIQAEIARLEAQRAAGPSTAAAPEAAPSIAQVTAKLQPVEQIQTAIFQVRRVGKKGKFEIVDTRNGKVFSSTDDAANAQAVATRLNRRVAEGEQIGTFETGLTPDTDAC